ncbi:hypothetical protein [Rhodopseudomonas sp. BR0G17]|uniref:hypothetical protein n=1 Tax=Rhodopseudomonas sp. BR0G17 TaxID=2269368 RepID=UPI0013DF5ED5|nr:hypothetical protein [Rhodopseudomonas sp. BR0G17]NEW96658.1 hypothetical protein [Rhodopseudomonas sp. BR0G17]
MSDDSRSLVLLLGELKGKLESHISAVDRDRAEREQDRVESAQHRKEVRHQLANMTMKVGAIDPLAARLDAIDDPDNKRSIVARLDAIEPQVSDLTRKAATAVAIATGALALIGYVLHMFGGEIKAVVLRIFRIS